MLGLDTTAVECRSPLPVEDCRRLLIEATDTPFTLFGKREVIGRIRGDRLAVHKRIRYRNSFQTFMSADLSEDGQGTLLSCRFGIRPLMRAFLIVWFGLAGTLGVIVIGQTLAELARQSFVFSLQKSLGLAIPVLLVTLGYAMVRFCRYLARDEQAFLMDFLEKTLRAKVVLLR